MSALLQCLCPCVLGPPPLSDSALYLADDSAAAPGHYGTADGGGNAFVATFRTLLALVQRESKNRILHPRELAFEALLGLYSHADAPADVVRRLSALFETKGGLAVRFFSPQLANFLLHGLLRPPERERIELFILDRCERSLHWAHKIFFFLAAFAPSAPYGSELCGPALAAPLAGGGAGGGGGGANRQPAVLPPLLRAVEVQGAIAAARLARTLAAIASAYPPRPVGVSAAAAAAAPFASHGHTLQTHQIGDVAGDDADGVNGVGNGACVGAGASSAASSAADPSASAAAAELAAAEVAAAAAAADASFTSASAAAAADALASAATAAPAEAAHAHASASTSSRADAARLLAPLPMSPALVHAFDSRTLALFQRVRANLAAASAASASTAAAPVLAPLALPSVAAAALSPRLSFSFNTPSLSPSSLRPGLGASPGESGGRALMTALGSPSDVTNGGPLMPAGGAASSLAVGGGGLAAFRETCAIVGELCRLSSLMSHVPFARRTPTLRAALDAVAARYLPSAAAYLPIGNCHHRLLALHSADSFCFKTAKRAPFLVVLEVVDYATASGLPLDRDDSDDDEEARERARRMRAVAEEREKRRRRDARRARLAAFRAHAASGPGSLARSLGPAVVGDLMAEGVRDAAESLAEAAGGLREGFKERAHRLGAALEARGLGVPRLHPHAAGHLHAHTHAHGYGQALGLGGGSGGGGGGRQGIDGGRDAASSSSYSHDVEGSAPAVGAAAAGVGSPANAAPLFGGRSDDETEHLRGGAPVARPLTRRQLAAVSDGDYAQLGSTGDVLGTGAGVGAGPGAGTGAGAGRRRRGDSEPEADGEGGGHYIERGGSDSDGAHSADEATARVLLDGHRSGGVKAGLVRMLRSARGTSADEAGPGGARGAGSGPGRGYLGRERDRDDRDAPPMLETDGLLQTAALVGQELQRTGQRVLRQSARRLRKEVRSLARGAGVVRSRRLRESLTAPGAAASTGDGAGTSAGVGAGADAGSGAGTAGAGNAEVGAAGPAVGTHEGHAGGGDADADDIDEDDEAEDEAAAGSGAGTTSYEVRRITRSAAKSIRRAFKRGAAEVLTTVFGDADEDDDDVIFGGGELTESGGLGGGGLGAAGHHGGEEYAEIASGPASASAAGAASATQGQGQASQPRWSNGNGAGSGSGGVQATTAAAPSAARAAPPLDPRTLLRELGQWGGHSSTASTVPPRPRPAVAVAASASSGGFSLALSPTQSVPLLSPSGAAMSPLQLTSPVSLHESAHLGAPIAGDAELDRELREGVPELGELEAELDPDLSIARAPAAEGVPATTATAAAAPAAAAPKPEADVVFAERWKEKEARLALASPYSHQPGWRLVPVIVKADDDLRQEQFVSQLLFESAAILRQARVPVWLRPYEILATSPSSGLIQAVPDTISLDALKRADPHFIDLNSWFERHFQSLDRIRVAKMNFARSLAGYSVLCYLLQIKDRHNGNILIDRRGHLLHIDFGFLLTSSPGGNLGFEAAGFKLSAEMLAVLGGPRSTLFATFRKLCVRAFLALRQQRARITLLVQMTLLGNAQLPCFVGGARAVISGLRGRFREESDERACVGFINRLIDDSVGSWRTSAYDAFQFVSQGVR